MGILVEPRGGSVRAEGGRSGAGGSERGWLSRGLPGSLTGSLAAPWTLSHLASSTVLGLQVGGMKESEKSEVKPPCCGGWLPPRPPSGVASADAHTLNPTSLRAAGRRWGSVRGTGRDRGDSARL